VANIAWQESLHGDILSKPLFGHDIGLGNVVSKNSEYSNIF